MQIRPVSLRYGWNIIDAMRAQKWNWINYLLKLVLAKKASDLHLDVGSAPILRVNGVLLPQEDKNQELYRQMQLGTQQRIRTLDDSLAELVGKYVITLEEALTRCVHPEQLRKMFETPGGKDRVLTGARKY